MIAAPLLLVYIAVGSGSDSALFAPVHALTTTGSNYDPSSLARKEEVRNLLRTLDQGNPLLGTGWGVPYDKVESFYANYDARWALYLYTPHNSILGLAAFSGLVGVIGIWGVVPTAAYLAARGYRGSIDPVQRTAGMVARTATGISACSHSRASWSSAPPLRRRARSQHGAQRCPRRRRCRREPAAGAARRRRSQRTARPRWAGRVLTPYHRGRDRRAGRRHGDCRASVRN